MNFLPKSPHVHTSTPRPPLPKVQLQLRPIQASPLIIDEETRAIVNEVFPIDDTDMMCFIVEDHGGEVFPRCTSPKDVKS